MPSENAGGRQEAEAVRRDGVKCPCSRRQPTPEYLLYLRHTLSPCCCCLPNTQTSRIQCLRVWVYAAVMVVVDRGNMGSVPSRHTKNDLFNTVREHLTLNLCETSPDRSTTENSGTETKSSAQRKEGASVGPCWPALRRAVGLTEI